MYDLSSWFPNCKGEQWVYYNDNSDYLIANASHQLRASVNEYVQRKYERTMVKMRLSMTYLMVSEKCPLNVEAIKNTKHRKIMSISGEFRSGEKFEFSEGANEIFGDLILSYARNYATLSLNLMSGDDLGVESRSHFKTGVENVTQLGISEGDEMGVIIFKVSVLDRNGRLLKPNQSKVRKKYARGRQFIKDEEYLIEKMPDLLLLLGGKKSQPIVPPDLEFCERDDVFYDLKGILELQGIRFNEDNWAIYNSNTDTMIVHGGNDMLEMVEMLLGDINYRNGLNDSNVTMFYEVDAKDEEADWDLVNVLSSKPILLGSVGYYQMSGEKTHQSSKHGMAVFERIRGETGWFDEQSYSINLDLTGRKIISERKLNVTYDKPIFIELQTDPVTKRAILMLIITKKYSVNR